MSTSGNAEASGWDNEADIASPSAATAQFVVLSIRVLQMVLR